MKKLKLVCLVILLFTFTHTASAQLRPRYRLSNVYRRSSIENYPADLRLPFLSYLNKGRTLADSGIKLLVQGKYAAFYQLTSKDLRKNYPQKEFTQITQIFDNLAGKITFYEYRSQAMEVPINTYLPEAFGKAVSNTTYAVRSTKVKSEYFIDIETTIENGIHRISFFVSNNYGENVPPWLTKPSKLPEAE